MRLAIDKYISPLLVLTAAAWLAVAVEKAGGLKNYNRLTSVARKLNAG